MAPSKKGIAKAKEQNKWTWKRKLRQDGNSVHNITSDIDENDAGSRESDDLTAGLEELTIDKKRMKTSVPQQDNKDGRNINKEDAGSRFDPKQLNIITWNINKNKHTEAFVTYLGKLSVSPHVVFLQETCIGIDQTIEIAGWKAFYTKYKPNQKGAAILVKDADPKTLKLYNQEVDRNGRYVIVQCKLLGQRYTFVSVYNHKKDFTTLDLLLPYLQTMSVGTLVIGGDFNTTFSKSDRATQTDSPPDKETEKKRKAQDQKTRISVKSFMRGLHLVDVFRRKTYGSKGPVPFTFKTRRTDKNTKEKYTILSRLDYFFLPEDYMCSVGNCEVLHVEKKDHSPLLLQLFPERLPKKKLTKKAHKWEVEDQQNISAVEIVAAIQSLHLTKLLEASEINALRSEYNKICHFKSKVMSDFFSDEYLILATILAWRLEDWGHDGKTKQRLTSREQDVAMTRTEAEWSDLKYCINERLNDHPYVNDFDILEELLQSSSDKTKVTLREGCPLTHILRKILRKYKPRPTEEGFTEDKQEDPDFSCSSESDDSSDYESETDECSPDQL